MKTHFIAGLCLIGVMLASCQSTITAPIEQAATSTQSQPLQILFLRPRCAMSYTVQADKPLEIHYGAWGAIGHDLAKENAEHLTVNLVLDGEPATGVQQSIVPFSTIPCGTPPDNSYGVFYVTKIESFSVGTHVATVTFFLDEQVTDGYDANGDGLIDLYGPGEVFNHQFTIIAK